VLLRGLELASTLEADMRKHLSSKRGRWGCETIHRLLQWIGLRAPRTTKSHTCVTAPVPPTHCRPWEEHELLELLDRAMQVQP
jgi:hypothetical protein